MWRSITVTNKNITVICARLNRNQPSLTTDVLQQRHKKGHSSGIRKFIKYLFESNFYGITILFPSKMKVMLTFLRVSERWYGLYVDPNNRTNRNTSMSSSICNISVSFFIIVSLFLLFLRLDMKYGISNIDVFFLQRANVWWMEFVGFIYHVMSMMYKIVRSLLVYWQTSE